MKPRFVYTASTAHNNVVLDDILYLYFKRPSLLADVTFCKGSFWKGLDVDLRSSTRTTLLLTQPLRRHLVLCSDLDPEATWPAIDNPVDCRALPYGDNYLDGLVFDPPYAGTGGQGKDGQKPSSYSPIQQYGNAFLGSRSVDEILKLYYAGINEAWRVLKPKGILILKTKDQIESGLQRYLSVDIVNYCTMAGLRAPWSNLDKLTVVSTHLPQMRHPYQHHARKNDSQFLLFKKRVVT